MNIRISAFLLLCLSIAINAQILTNYGNGNFGKGPDNQVTGANNTWIGKQNTIKGQQNTVVGDQNKIKGQNNIVQGNNNVVGDLSPEEMAKLQNQMMDSMESRFASMFKTFNVKPSIATEVPLPSKEPTFNKNTTSLNSQKLASEVPKNDQPPKEANPSISKSQTVLNPPEKKEPSKIDKQSNKQPKQTKQTKQTKQKQEISQSKHRLIFRTYGNYGQDTKTSDWINRINGYSNLICQRFNKCFQKQRNMFFSSIYPLSFFNHQQ